MFNIFLKNEENKIIMTMTFVDLKYGCGNKEVEGVGAGGGGGFFN